MALLRVSFTDEEERGKEDRKHPLTTPEYVSVRQSTMSSSKRSPSGRKEPKGQKFFLRKAKKDKSIFLFP
jgi:hypothetical protein